MGSGKWGVGCRRTEKGRTGWCAPWYGWAWRGWRQGLCRNGRLADDGFAYLAALLNDIQASSGVSYAHTLQVVVFNRSILVGSYNRFNTALTMQLNSITIMDIVAYGGAALGMIVAILQYRAGHTDLTGTLFIILLSA